MNNEGNVGFKNSYSHLESKASIARHLNVTLLSLFGPILCPFLESYEAFSDLCYRFEHSGIPPAAVTVVYLFIKKNPRCSTSYPVIRPGHTNGVLSSDVSYEVTL